MDDFGRGASKKSKVSATDWSAVGFANRAGKKSEQRAARYRWAAAYRQASSHVVEGDGQDDLMVDNHGASSRDESGGGGVPAAALANADSDWRFLADDDADSTDEADDDGAAAPELSGNGDNSRKWGVPQQHETKRVVENTARELPDLAVSAAPPLGSAVLSLVLTTPRDGPALGGGAGRTARRRWAHVACEDGSVFVLEDHAALSDEAAVGVTPELAACLPPGAPASLRATGSGVVRAARAGAWARSSATAGGGGALGPRAQAAAWAPGGASCCVAR